MNQYLSKCVLTIIICLITQSIYCIAESTEHSGRLTADIVKSRGYPVEEHAVISGQYKVNLVRIINPLITGGRFKGQPVLFIHGIRTSGSCYIENSEEITGPADWTSIDPETASLDELLEQLSGQPHSKSLPFLLSNFGFDVWLLSMRSSRESVLLNQFDWKSLNSLNSQGSNDGRDNRTGYEINGNHANADQTNKVDLFSGLVGGMNAGLMPLVTQFKAQVDTMAEVAMANRIDYWNYAYDEQANGDLPTVIDYILEHNGNKAVRAVCHSAGCAVFLMSMSGRPEYGDKVSHAALWAPALDLGNLKRNIVYQVVSALEPIFDNTIVPITSAIIDQVYSDTVTAICKEKSLSSQECTRLLNNFEGESMGQNLARLRYIMPISSREFGQILQSVNKGRMHYFDYGNPVANNRIYHSDKPPIYDIGLVRVKKVSIWQGNTDALVITPDTAKIANDLPDNIDVEYHFINGTGIAFSHYGFLVHMYNDRLLNIPVLKFFVS